MSTSRTHWKKPPTRVYDYNYNLGEHYYKPLLRHADLKFHGRAGSPPKAKTFAERFAAEPVYGSYGLANSIRGRQSSLTDDIFTKPRSLYTGSASEEREFGRSRFNTREDFGEFVKPRRPFGDRVLDAAGAERRGISPRPPIGRHELPASPRIQESDPFNDSFFQVSGSRSQAGKGGARGEPLFADSDFTSENPRIRSKPPRGVESFASNCATDDYMDDIKRESETAASRFRAKLRAKQAAAAQEDSHIGSTSVSFFDDDGSTESKIEKIRQRAKARIAEAMEDDYQPTTNFGKNYGFGGDDLDIGNATSGAGSKSVKISKRSLKTTFDID